MSFKDPRRRFDSVATLQEFHINGRRTMTMSTPQSSLISDKKQEFERQQSIEKYQESGSGWGTRHILVILSMLVNLVSYVMRSNINLTIIAMVVATNKTDSNQIESCGYEHQTLHHKNNSLLLSNDFYLKNMTNTYKSLQINNHNTIYEMTDDITDSSKFSWSESMQGTIIGGFYYGYIITNIYGGQLADVVGTRLLLSVSLGVSSFMTLLIPFAAHTNVYFLVAVRFIMGLSQGVITSALYTLVPYWIPKDEQGVVFSLIMSSGQLGAVISLPLCAFLIQYGPGKGWISVFYVCGAMGFALLGPWIYFVRNTPEEHPKINSNELDYIRANVVSHNHTNGNDNEHSTHKASVPWCSIISSFKVWIVAITRFCTSWGNLFLISKLPAYLNSILHLSLDYNSYVNASIYITLCLSLFLWGFVSDYVQHRKLLGRTISRKLFQSIGMLGGGAFLAIVPLFGCNIWLVIIILNLSMVMVGLTTGGENLVCVDIAPDFAGSVYGFTNAFASMPGVLAPLVVGVMLDQSSNDPKQEWDILFWIGAAVYTFGAIIFTLFVSTKPEPWGVIEDNATEQTSQTNENINKV